MIIGIIITLTINKPLLNFYVGPSCSTPISPPNGNYTPQGVAYFDGGPMVMYYCNEGFHPTQVMTTTCIGGLWLPARVRDLACLPIEG